MYESLGFETLTAQAASVLFGLALGALFGAIALHLRFCFRRAVAGPAHERRQALAVWCVALAAALLGTRGAVGAGWIDFDAHRFLSAELPVLAVLVGGLLFGSGMVLTRGCVSRLAVLSGSGNLRAALSLLTFAVVAHATLKGVLAPLRVALGGYTLDLGATTSFAALPGGVPLWTAVLVALCLATVVRSGLSLPEAALAAVLGLLVPLSWLGTGWLLYDEFEPIAFQAMSFTAPSADTLFWSIASTSIPAGFGVGFLGGVLGGSLLMSLGTRRLHWQSFESPRQTGRYVGGAVLMGIGGVLAGGCTIGAGLSGIPTLGFGAALALASMFVGARVTVLLLDRQPSAPGVGAEPAFEH